MAKSYHLSKIIDPESGNTGLRTLGNQRREGLEGRASILSHHRKSIDELTLWRTALQVESFVIGRSK